MSADVVARGLAARAQAATPRVPIDLCIVGQSNERGQVDPAETIDGVASRTAWPQAYQSLRNPAFTYPVAPAVSRTGGVHFKLYDDLFDWGYDARIVNLGIGSASFLTDMCGRVTAWAPRAYFRAARAAIPGSSDRGFTGDIIVEGGRVFVATTGYTAVAMHSGPGPIMVGSAAVEVDYTGLYAPPGDAQALLSGTDKPNFAAVTAVGQTIADGGAVWTCIATSPALAGTSYTTGMVMGEGQHGYGFDPYGILATALAALKAGRGAHRIVILENGQADAAASAADYSAAIANMAGFFLSRGNIQVMPGLTCYSPTIPTGDYETLTQEMEFARDQLLRAGPRRDWVQPGANLYRLMGTDGAMAAGGRFFAKDAGRDDIHLNAPGAIEAGRHIANAVKAWLPRIAR